MFDFARSLDPWIGVGWLGVLTVTAFLISWLGTDVARVRRTPYIALLSVVTAGCVVGFLAWTGAGTAFWTDSWVWGLVGGVVTAFLMLVVTRRLPRARSHGISSGAAVWEGVVYGTAEGVLLSMLPVAIAWQIFRSFGWDALPAAIVAVAVSIGVIVIHHLGYWEFRSRLMRFPVLFCGLLSVAYLLTGNPIPSIAGHIVLHLAMMRKGVELPPHVRPVAVSEPRVAPRAA